MPLYEYKCDHCGFVFEELKTYKEAGATTSCIDCGSQAQKIVSSCATVIAGGSTNESADMNIGREANKRWERYSDLQSTRRGNNKLEVLTNIPKTKEGSYTPVMGLGDQSEKEKRKDYVGALQQHRKERIEKGIPQFDKRGAF